MWSSPLARDLFGWVYVRGKSNIYLVSGFASLSLSPKSENEAPRAARHRVIDR